MKKTLTHHQFYSLCCAIENNPEAQSMSDADLVIHINDAIGLAVTPDWPEVAQGAEGCS